MLLCIEFFLDIVWIFFLNFEILCLDYVWCDFIKWRRGRKLGMKYLGWKFYSLSIFFEWVLSLYFLIKIVCKVWIREVCLVCFYYWILKFDSVIC